MSTERINPAELAEPSGFSHAVTVTGARAVYLAGQTALDRHGAITGEDVVTQFELALSNVLTALRAAGGQPQDLAHVTVYLVDVDGYKANAREIGSVWRRLVGKHYPAMAAVGVARLWDIEALVEVQAIAAIGG